MMLDKGMIIYRKPGTFNKFTRLEITRVTPTQAIAKDGNRELRFDRDVKDGKRFHERGEHGYGIASYAIESDDIKAQYERDVKEQAFARIDVKSLRIEQLDAILTIVDGR